jgi:ABC-type glycerol-3-phosphate transport system permease component
VTLTSGREGSLRGVGRHGDVWVALGVLVPLAFVMVVPFVWMYLSSFKTPLEILQPRMTLLPRTIQLEAYTSIWQETPLLRGYLNSIVVATVGVLAVVLTSSLGGYLFAKKRFVGQSLLLTFVLSTLMVPHFILLIPSYFMYVSFGIKDTYIALVLPYIFSPLGLLLVRQFLHSVPNDLIEAAVMDGAGDWTIWWHVIAPLSRQILAAIAIFEFLAVFNAFLWPLVIIDSEGLFTLPLVLRRITGRETTREDQVLAAAVMAVTPLLLFFLRFQQHFVRGVTLTGIKA